jgi:hypothetical protein
MGSAYLHWNGFLSLEACLAQQTDASLTVVILVVFWITLLFPGHPQDAPGNDKKHHALFHF